MAGSIERDDGRFEPAGELGDLAIPETLHALIAARLDALAPEDRMLVQDAAVLGQSFTTAALAAVSGLEPMSSSSGSALWSEPTSSTVRSIRDHRNAASTRSSRPSSARSPTRPLRCVTGAAGTSRRRATSSRSATTSSPAHSRPLPRRISVGP